MKNKNLEKHPTTIANPLETAGILLVNKPKGKTSFSLVSALRKMYGVKKIGHAGTLDPFATGVMIMLIGKQFTRLSDRFLNQDKEYIATLRLGIRTDSYDCEGKILEVSDYVPTEEQIFAVLEQFQGNILQIPPMFSAKKINGKKLYELARKGISVEREAKPVNVSIRFLSFEYPYLCLHVRCSKGTYIRSLADDIGKALGTFAHLTELSRTRCGPYHIAECVDGSFLSSPSTYPPFKLLSYEATYDHCL